MRQFAAKSLISLVLPLVVKWARRQEARILAEGRTLTVSEAAFASWLGVSNPGEIRVLEIEQIPMPGKGLRWIARLTGYPHQPPAGMALGRGVFVKQKLAKHRELVAHELVHVAQYQRLGGLESFLKCYLMECLMQGYEGAPLEIEAQEKAQVFG